MDTIRQTCPQCRSTLELPSSAIGRMARCPACQHTFRVTVAESPALAEGAQAGTPQKPQDAPAYSGGFTESSGEKAAPSPSDSAPTYTGNPYSAANPPAPTTYANPYAFSPGMGSTAALQVDKSPIEVRTASIDAIVSASVSIFSARWQPLVLSGLIYFVATIVVLVANIAINAVVEINEMQLAPAIMFAAGVIVSFITWYLSLGLMNVAIMAARGVETGPGKMFVGPNVFGRLFVLIAVLAVIGTSHNLLPLFMEGDEMAIAVASLLGMAFVSLILGLVLWPIWPTFFLVVDGRSAEGGGLSMGFQIATSNLLNSFLIGLIAVVLSLASTFTCTLGAIVTQPLLMLVGAVAYLLMTSQPISDPSKMPYSVPNYGQ